MNGTTLIIGCGWLGRAIASALVFRGVRVIGTTTRQENVEAIADLGVEPKVVRFGPEVAGERGTLQGVEAVVVAVPPGRGAEAIEEAAAIARFVDTTRAGTVVQISTSSVYPDTGGVVFEADAIPGHRLVRVEETFHSLDRSVAVLRCTGLFGPGRIILPFLLRSGRAVDPDGRVNFVAQSDVVRAVLRVLDEPVRDTFNVCADEHPTRREFYSSIAERAGMEIPRFESTGEPFRIVDNSKFRTRFGFEYEYPDPCTFPF